MFVPDGKGGEEQACIADRIPVDRTFVEPGKLVVFGGGEGFFAEGSTIGVPPLRGQPVIQPVVAEADGQGHFSGIEEMRGIPVSELADGVHFPQGAVGIGFLAVHPPGVRQPEHPFQGLAGGAEHPPPDQDAFQDGSFQQAVAIGQDQLVRLPQDWLGGEGFPDPNLFAFAQQQPRVWHGVRGDDGAGGQGQQQPDQQS